MILETRPDKITILGISAFEFYEMGIVYKCLVECLHDPYMLGARFAIEGFMGVYMQCLE